LRLDHQNIVKHHEFFIIQSDTFGGIEEHLYIVMEYCQTSVENVIKSRKTPLPDSVILSWIRQTLYGLHYLHQHEILHRDIKTDNLLLCQLGPTGQLLDNMEEWTIKLCDFGFATDMKQLKKNVKPGGSEHGMLVGTPLYMGKFYWRNVNNSAPEIQMLREYDTKADLWSLGVVILQLLMNKAATEMPQLFEEVSKNTNYVKQLCEQNVSSI
jgi:serine/threonine protein kinase